MTRGPGAESFAERRGARGVQRGVAYLEREKPQGDGRGHCGRDGCAHRGPGERAGTGCGAADPGAGLESHINMAARGRAAVAVTDDAWFNHFRPEDRLATWDEVNFWRPLSTQEFSLVDVGGPVFFRRKAPRRAIAGFGFFAAATRMTVAMAWEVFGDRNGDPTFERFVGRLGRYRERFGAGKALIEDQQLSCLILRDAVFLPDRDWLPWTALEGWSEHIVSMKGYDLSLGVGQVLTELLLNVGRAAPADLLGEFEATDGDARLLRDQTRSVREGQGAFRVRLLDAYRGRCAVTGEHAAPVLDAAHIQPYLGPRSNHIQNGLVLRTDLHRLFDEGYVTVTPEYRFAVSPRLRDEFENGKTYYEMDGRQILVPATPHMQPSRPALEWHATRVFR